MEEANNVSCAGNESGENRVHIAMLPLSKQLKLLDKALLCPETPQLAKYATAFMRVFCVFFSKTEPLIHVDAYWQFRSARTPLALLKALNNRGTDLQEACRLLETVEDCVAHVIGSLPFPDALEKEAAELKPRFRDSVKSAVKLRYVDEVLRAARNLSVDELRQLSNSVFDMLAHVK